MQMVKRKRKSVKILGYLFLVLLVGAACRSNAYASDAGPAAKENASSGPQLSIEEKWGIRILGVRAAAGGSMLDFRYRVLDVTKAAPFFDRKTKPYLIDAKSGARLVVPSSSKLGSLRQTPKFPVPNKNYFVLFANPGVVKPGGKVTVVIGDFRAENLVVE